MNFIISYYFYLILLNLLIAIYNIIFEDFCILNVFVRFIGIYNMICLLYEGNLLVVRLIGLGCFVLMVMFRGQGIIIYQKEGLILHCLICLLKL